MTRVENEPVFVLHRRAYRDTSLLVDVFSLNHGRISAVARAARSSRSSWSGLIEPFRPLEAGWSRRGELATLAMLEPAGPWMRLTGQAVWSGLYANELVMTLTARDDPEPAIFHAYARLMAELGLTGRSGPLLRKFEMSVLQALGVAPDLACCVESGQPVSAERRYRLDVERGALPHAGESGGIPGAVLLALVNQDPLPKEFEHQALLVMRQLLDHQLAGRSLRTPALYRELNS